MTLDVVVRGGTVIAMDGTPPRVADVHLRGDRILAIGRVEAPRARVLDARGAAVIPGFVQAHVHLCQTLFRGHAADLPLLAWLAERIWPLEAAHDEASLRASAELGLAEMLLSGTTSILDMGTVHHHDVVMEAMVRSGIRGSSGKAMMDRGAGVPKGLRESTRESLAESDALASRWHGAADGRVRYAYAPRFVLSCSRKLLEATAERARARGCLLHTHAAEHAEERALARRVLGMDDVAALAAAGFEGPDVVLAHGVQLRAAEMRRLAKHGTRVVHCPSANLKLASGIADVRALRDAGVVVGLGSDGAPCNDTHDPFVEMRSAALLAKVKRRDAAALPAAEALALATREGARVLGLDDVGVLVPGAKADVVVVGLGGLAQTPSPDPIGALVYASRGADVRHVVVDGRVVVQRGELLGVDVERVAARALEEARRVARRAGIELPTPEAAKPVTGRAAPRAR
ncbi:MAG: amidohydrolase family protein [Polyangiales bacterium]